MAELAEKSEKGPVVPSEEEMNTITSGVGASSSGPLYALLQAGFFFLTFAVIGQVVNEVPFNKESFLWMQSLAAPNYEAGVGLDWFGDNGFLSYHDDLMWPNKFRYFVLPFLLSL